MLFQKYPDYGSLRIFGSKCFPCLRDYVKNKLELPSLPCVFLGYSDHYKSIAVITLPLLVCTSRSMLSLMIIPSHLRIPGLYINFIILLQIFLIFRNGLQIHQPQIWTQTQATWTVTLIHASILPLLNSHKTVTRSFHNHHRHWVLMNLMNIIFNMLRVPHQFHHIHHLLPLAPLHQLI